MTVWNLLENEARQGGYTEKLRNWMGFETWVIKQRQREEK